MEPALLHKLLRNFEEFVVFIMVIMNDYFGYLLMEDIVDMDMTVSARQHMSEFCNIFGGYDCVCEAEHV